MSNLVTVNSGSAINGTLKAGRIAIATSASISPTGFYNMMNPAGGYVFITDPKVQGYSDGSPSIFQSPSTLPADILATINGLPDRRGSVPFDNVWDALVWVQSTEKYFILNKTPYKYPSGNLKFYFDAGEPSSYPQSGSVAYDLALTNEGDLTNGPTFNQNGWIEFDGTNDTIDFGDVSDLDFGTNSFTVAALCYMSSADSQTDFRSIVSKKSSGGTSAGWILRRNDNDRFTFFPADGSAREDATETTASPLDRWQFALGMLDEEDNKSRLYVGNEERQTNNFSSFGSVDNSADFLIGGWGASTDYWKGDIAKVWAYNKKLSNDEINHLYFGANIVTDSLSYRWDAGNLVSYDKTSTTTFALTGSISGSLNNGVEFHSEYEGYWEFDGSNDNIILEGSTDSFRLNQGDNWTVNAWVRTTQVGSAIGDAPIMSNSQSGPVWSVFKIHNGKIGFSHYNNAWLTSSGSVDVNDGDWHMLTWSNLGDGTMDLYVDGVLDTAGVDSALSAVNRIDAIGRSWSAYFDGDIANVQVNKGTSFNASQVAQQHGVEYPRFKSSRDITKEDLVLELDAHNPDSYLSGTTWTDLSGNGSNGTLTNNPTFDLNNGGAINFDGTDDYVSVSNFPSSTAAFTMVCWFIKDSNGNQSFLGRTSGGSGTKIIFLSNNNIFFRMVEGGSSSNFDIGYSTDLNGKWNLLVATRSSSGVVKASLNGNSLTSGATLTGTFSPIAIGRNGDGQYLDGKISNMRMYDRELSLQEIQSIYTTEAPRYQVQLPRSTTDSLKLNLDAGDTTSYSRTGTTWYDRSGNGNNATLYNSPTYTIAEGGVFDLDGTDDYFRAPASAAGMYNFGTDGTLEMWFRPDASFTTNHRLLCVTNNASAIDVYINSSGQLRLHGNRAYATQTVLINEWTHLIVTYVGGTVQIYFNGEAQTMAGTKLTGYNITNNNDLFIGQFSGGGSYYFNGKIANAKIYHRGLTPSEVLENYKSARSRFGTDGIVTSNLDLSVDFGNVDSYDNSSTTINDLSGNGNNGTLTNGPIFNSEVGGNASFDDTDDYITFGNPSITQYTYTDDFSLEIWINPDTTSGFKHLIGKTYGNYRLAQNGTGVSFRLDTNVLATQSGTLVIGKWTHIVATYEASTKTARVYQDGVLVQTSSNSNLNWTSGSGNFQLGNSPGENYYFGGKIALGRAYGKKLTDAEVLQNYNAVRNRFGLD